MIVALFPNTTKRQSAELANEIALFLRKNGVDIVVSDEDSAAVEAPLLSSIDPKTVDITICMGGDGTILRLMHTHPNLGAPIMAINLGSLGFMADIPTSEVHASLQHLINGTFTVHERIMMDGITTKGDKCLALNEIVIHRAENPCLVDLSIHVDGIYLNTFSADGVILATPSGSTAYSLAAGGPILAPDLNVFVITPICPHTLSNRPIVLMPEKSVQIRYESARAPVEVTYDGFCDFHIASGEDIHISVSKKRFRLISLSQHDYFSTLRTKLGWAGNLIPK